MFTWRREAPDRRGNVWRVTPTYHVFIACVAGVKRGRGNLGALIPFAFPFKRLPRRLMYLKNVIKLKWEIMWTGELPHLSRSPHLPRVPHLHVNRSLNYPLIVFDVQSRDCVVNYVDLFWKVQYYSSVNYPWVQKLVITILSASLAYEKRVTSFELRKKDLALDRSSKLRRLVVLKKDKSSFPIFLRWGAAVHRLGGAYFRNFTIT